MTVSVVCGTVLLLNSLYCINFSLFLALFFVCLFFAKVYEVWNKERERKKEVMAQRRDTRETGCYSSRWKSIIQRALIQISALCVADADSDANFFQLVGSVNIHKMNSHYHPAVLKVSFTQTHTPTPNCILHVKQVGGLERNN